MNPENVRSLTGQLNSTSVSNDLIIFFVPTKTKENKDIPDSEQWVDATIKIATEIFGGATVMAPAKGAWYNPESGQIIRETVHLVHTYGRLDESMHRLPELALFLHRMGRETDQGEIGVVVAGCFHRITDYSLGK